jgi:CRP-like cAMP-binding protein
VGTDDCDLLDGLELFIGFSYPEIRVFQKYLTRMQILKGTVIFKEGDAGDSMFILASGKVAIFKGVEGSQHILSREARGRVIGEMSLLDSEPRSAGCIAEVDSVVFSLSNENLKLLAYEHAGLAYKFTTCLARLLSKRLRRTTGLLAELLEA